MSYKLNPGWTKQRMKDQIKKYNNGSAAMLDGECTYLAPDGNRCVVGCFIPDGHEALGSAMLASQLHEEWPELDLPIGSHGLLVLQEMHDFYERREGLHEYLFDWIDKYVEEK